MYKMDKFKMSRNYLHIDAMEGNDSSCTEEDTLNIQGEESDDRNLPSRRDMAGPSRQTTRMRSICEIFPWLTEIHDTLKLNLKLEQDQKNVLPIMEKYRKLIKEHLPSCIRYPNRCFILSKNITKMLLLFRDLNINFNDSHDYLITLCDLLGIYTSLELKYSTKFEEAKLVVANRIVLNYETHLHSIDKSYILRIFMSIKHFCKQKEIMCQIFEKYLKHNRYVQQELDDRNFVMYLIAFKYWRLLEDEADERAKIDQIANSFMRPSPNLRVNQFYAPFIPPYTTSTNATSFILSSHFSPILLIQAFYREELYSSEDTFLGGIIDISLDDPIVVNDTDTPSNSHSNLKHAPVKLEKPEVVAIIDLTAEDKLRKHELSWLDSLIEKARSSKFISIPKPTSIENVKSNLSIIIIDDDDEDEQENADNNKLQENNQISKQITETSTKLTHCSLGNKETVDKINEQNFGRADQSDNTSEKVLENGGTGNDMSLGQHVITENNKEVVIKTTSVNIDFSLNESRTGIVNCGLLAKKKINETEPIEIIKETATGSDNKVASSDTANEMSANSGQESNKLILDIPQRTSNEKTSNKKLTLSESKCEETKEYCTDGKEISQDRCEKKEKDKNKSLKCNDIENIALDDSLTSPQTLTDEITLNHRNENNDSTPESTSNIPVGGTNLSNILKEATERDITSTANEKCNDVSFQDQPMEVEEPLPIENYMKNETLNTFKNTEHIDKFEKMLVDKDRDDINLKMDIHSIEDTSTNKTDDTASADSEKLINTEQICKEIVTFVLGNESNTALTDTLYDSDNRTRNNSSLEEEEIIPEQTISMSIEKKFVSDEMNSVDKDFQNTRVKLGEMKNESNINIERKSPDLSDDNDDVIKNIAKSLTMAPKKNSQKKKKSDTPDTYMVNVPSMKENFMLDLPDFSSTSSDSDEDSSILEESDQLDEENHELKTNRKNEIDDIPIDKITTIKPNVETEKPSKAYNVIFSTPTNPRSALAPPKLAEVMKSLPTNSNVVFSTSKQIISRNENSVKSQNRVLHDSWIDTAIDFEDNDLGIHQNEIISPPMEEFTKSDKTLFKTYLNKTVDPSNVRTTNFQDDCTNSYPDKELNDQGNSNTSYKKNQFTPLTSTETFPHESDDNLINFLPNIQKRKSVSFNIVEDTSAQTTNRIFSTNKNSGISNTKNLSTPTKLNRGEYWTTQINTYNSNFDIPQHKPTSPPHQTIISPINIKPTQPTTPRRPDPEHHHSQLLTDRLKLDDKLFSAQISIKRIDEKVKVPVLDEAAAVEIQKKKAIRKTLSDFDRFLMRKKLENLRAYAQLNQTFVKRKEASIDKRCQSTGSHKAQPKRQIRFAEPKQIRLNKKTEKRTISNVRQTDPKLRKKVVVRLEDVVSSGEFNQNFSSRACFSKETIPSGDYAKSKYLYYINKPLDKDFTHISNTEYNYHLHTEENSVSNENNSINSEILVQVFKDSVENSRNKNLAQGTSNDGNIVDVQLKKLTHKVEGRTEASFNQNRPSIDSNKISVISNVHIDTVSVCHNMYLPSCNTNSRNEELVSNLDLVERSLKIDTSQTTCNSGETSFIKSQETETNVLSVNERKQNGNNNIDTTRGPIPRIEINPNHPPEPDKNNTVDSHTREGPCNNLELCITLNAPEVNKGDLQSSSQLSCFLGEPALIVDPSVSASSSSNKNTSHGAIVFQEEAKSCSSSIEERDDEVTSTQGNIRTRLFRGNSPSINTSKSQIDVQNDQVDTSNLIDSAITPRNMNRGRRKSVLFNTSSFPSTSCSRNLPKRRKTCYEETAYGREKSRLDDMVNIPSTTTIIDTPRKRNRPGANARGSRSRKKNIKPNIEGTVNIEDQTKKYKFSSIKNARDDVMSVSSITSTSSRESDDNEPLARIRDRLARAKASDSQTSRGQSPENLNVNAEISKTYSKDYIKNVFVPPEIEKIIEDEASISSGIARIRPIIHN